LVPVDEVSPCPHNAHKRDLSVGDESLVNLQARVRAVVVAGEVLELAKYGAVLALLMEEMSHSTSSSAAAVQVGGTNDGVHDGHSHFQRSQLVLIPRSPTYPIQLKAGRLDSLSIGGH
jgi:hypothetical protein